MRVRPYRWHGSELEKLRIAYETSGLMVADLAVDFQTSPGRICCLVRQHGWKRRGRERLPLPSAARKHANWYRKLQAEFGREAALEAIVGAR